MKRSPPPRRKAKLKPGGPLARTGGPRRSSPAPRRRTTAELRAEGKDFSDETRTAVLQRAGHRCEVGLEGCMRHEALQCHHRKLRRHGDHSAENCIVACYWCHQIAPDAIHSGQMVKINGQVKLVAEVTGWFVRSYSDPAALPWLRRGETWYPSGEPGAVA